MGLQPGPSSTSAKLAHVRGTTLTNYEHGERAHFDAILSLSLVMSLPLRHLLIAAASLLLAR